MEVEMIVKLTVTVEVEVIVGRAATVEVGAIVGRTVTVEVEMKVGRAVRAEAEKMPLRPSRSPSSPRAAGGEVGAVSSRNPPQKEGRAERVLNLREERARLFRSRTKRR